MRRGKRVSYCGYSWVSSQVPLSRLAPIPHLAWVLAANSLGIPSPLFNLLANLLPFETHAPPNTHPAAHSWWLINPGCRGKKSFAVQFFLVQFFLAQFPWDATQARLQLRSGLAQLLSPPYSASLLPVSWGHSPSMPCMRIPALGFFQKSSPMRHWLRKGAPGDDRYILWSTSQGSLMGQGGTRIETEYSEIFEPSLLYQNNSDPRDSN